MDLDHLSKQFRKSMINNYIVFNQHSFRRHTLVSELRSVINVALFDVFSVLMTRFSTKFVENNTHELHQRFFSLMQNDEFAFAITLSTNSVKKVVARFKIVEQVYKDLIQ